MSWKEGNYEKSFEILDSTMGQQLPTKNYGKEQEVRTACGPVNQQKFVYLRNCAPHKPFNNLDFRFLYEH